MTRSQGATHVWDLFPTGSIILFHRPRAAETITIIIIINIISSQALLKNDYRKPSLNRLIVVIAFINHANICTGSCRYRVCISWNRRKHCGSFNIPPSRTFPLLALLRRHFQRCFHILPFLRSSCAFLNKVILRSMGKVVVFKTYLDGMVSLKANRLQISCCHLILETLKLPHFINLY